jgi:predicted transcriptional regulator
MANSEPDEAVILLKQLLAIELWRGGLTQAEIKARLGIGSATVSEWLKGVSREVTVWVKSAD